MKKKYITPRTAVVKVRLLGSVLEPSTINQASNTTTIVGAREDSNGFDWDDDEEKAVNIWK